MAADSRLSRNQIILPEKALKIVKSKTGHIGAICGSYDAQAEFFLRWIKGGCVDEPVYPKADSAFIMVTLKGRLQEFVKDGQIQLINHWGYYAWGSGVEFAMGALAHGATAIEAVEIAIRHDPFSGGKIRHYSVG